MKLFTLTFVFTMFVLPLSATEPSRFGKVDGLTVGGTFVDVDLKTKARVYARYPTDEDSGAELELVIGDKLVWREYVQGLGTMHLYRQTATLHLQPENSFSVIIRGRKTIYEERDLKTGKLLSRSVGDK